MYVAENAAGAELILILQVRAVAPFQHQYGKTVRAGVNEVGDIELSGGVGDLAVANVRAIEPHIEAGIHTLEREIRAGCLGVRCIVKIPNVGAARVVLGNMRRIERDRVAHVSVLVVVIT